MTPTEALSFLQQLAVKNPKQPLIWAATQSLAKRITLLEQKLYGNPVDVQSVVNDETKQTEYEEIDEDDSSVNGLG